jgi:hypothetical protein
MKSKLELIFVLLLGLAIAPVAHADAAAGMDEATITVVDDGDTPDDVVKVIELPARASASGVAKSASGIDTANSAKDKSGDSSRDFGQQISEDARSKNVSDQVRADAKQQGKSEARGNNAGGNGHAPPR